MTKFLSTLFTGKDNDSADIGRVLWTAAYVVFLGMAIYQGIKSSFDLMTYVGAASGLLAGGSAALRIKASTEPGHPG